jgi:hypothetical protein
MAPKRSKAVFKLDILLKEIDHFENKITSCEDIESRPKVNILKGKIKDYENN